MGNFGFNFWNTTPVISKYWMVISLLTTFGSYFGFFTRLDLFYNPYFIFQKHQFWRLFTPFFFFGDLENLFFLKFFLNFLFIFRAEESFLNRPYDFLFMLIFGGIILLLVELYGNEALVHIYKFLVEIILKNIQKNSDDKFPSQISLFKSLLHYFHKSTQLLIIFTSFFEKYLVENKEMIIGFLNKFMKLSNLENENQILFALSFAESGHEDVSKEGISFFEKNFSEAFAKCQEKLEFNILHDLLILFTQKNLSKQKQELLIFLEQKSKDFPQYETLLFSETNQISFQTKMEEDNIGDLMKSIDETLTLFSVATNMKFPKALLDGSFAQVLSFFPNLSALDIAQTILEISKQYSHVKQSNTQNQESNENKNREIEEIIQIFNKNYTDLNWEQVIYNLDFPEFRIPDPECFEFMINFFAKATSKPFPIAFALKKWGNPLAQISFLEFASNAPPHLIDFSMSKVFQPLKDSLTIPKQAGRHHQAWLSLTFVELLLDLSQYDPQKVEYIFQVGTQSYAELVFQAIIQVPWNNVFAQTLARKLSLISLFSLFEIFPKFSRLIEMLWQRDIKFVIDSINLFWRRKPETISRLFDILMKLQGLLLALDSQKWDFVLEFASLASSRECINLDIWIKNKMQTEGEIFVEECFNFLDRKYSLMEQISENPEKKHLGTILSANSIIAFFHLLYYLPISNFGDDNLKKKIEKLFNKFYELVPKLKLFEKPFPDESNFSPQVEAQTNSLFENIYNKTIKPQDAIILLKKWKDSSSKEEQKVYECFIQNIFQEYLNLEKYPEENLQINADLFGLLIQNDALPDHLMENAIKLILDAIRHHNTTNIHKFGILSLNKFKNRISEWTNIAEIILQDSQFSQLYPAISAEISGYLIQKQQPQEVQQVQQVQQQNMQSMQPQDNTNKTSPNQFQNHGQNQNISQSENMREINFLVNILDQGNLPNKAFELKENFNSIDVINYARIISTSASFAPPQKHLLYINLIDRLGNADFANNVILVVFYDIGSIIHSENLQQKRDIQTRLNNLGSFLGLLTLSKNKPILRKYLDIKHLLIDSLRMGMLHIVVPFIVSILFSCANSKVFHTKNPWLVPLLSILAYIHNYPKVLSGIKRRIEDLFMILRVDISSLPTMKSQEEMQASDLEKNTEFNMMMDQGKFLMYPKLSFPNDSNTNNDVTNELAIEDDDYIFQFSKYLQVPENYPLYTKYPNFRKFIFGLLSHIFMRLKNDVLEQSIEIATKTAYHLVTKDFANEPDINKMKTAAHLMVANLAVNLTIFGEKQLSNDFDEFAGVQFSRFFMNKDVQNEAKEIEAFIRQVWFTNKQILFSLAESISSSSAQSHIDEVLERDYFPRYQARENNFYGGGGDVRNDTKNPFTQNLIEELFPKSGILPWQLNIYSSFANFRETERLDRDEALGQNENENYIKISQQDFLEFFQKWIVFLQNIVENANKKQEEEVSNKNSNENNQNQDEDDLEISETIKKLISEFIKMLRNCEEIPQVSFIVCKELIVNIRELSKNLERQSSLLLFQTFVYVLGQTNEIFTKYFDSQIKKMPNIAVSIRRNLLTTEITSHVIQDVIVVDPKKDNEVRVNAALDLGLIYSLFKESLLDLEPFADVMVILMNIPENAKEREFYQFLFYDCEKRQNIEQISDLKNATKQSITKLLEQQKQLESQQNKQNINQAALILSEDTLGFLDQILKIADQLESILISKGILPTRHGHNDQENDSGFDSKARDDQAVLRQSFLQVFQEWHEMIITGTISEKMDGFVKKLQSVVIKYHSQFFTVLTNACVNLCLSTLQNSADETQTSTEDSANTTTQNTTNPNNTDTKPDSEKISMEKTKKNINQNGNTNEKNQEDQINEQKISETETETETEPQTQENPAVPEPDYTSIVEYSLMLFVLVSKYKDSLNPEYNVVVLRQILHSIVESLLSDFRENRENFHSGPYHILLSELLGRVTDEETLQKHSFLVLREFYDAFIEIEPEKVPTFIFSWIELISNIHFMGKLLIYDTEHSMQMVHDLLQRFLKFIQPFLRDVKLDHSVRLLYKALLRIFLFLLKIFPDFLSRYYFSFCDSIPLNCIQLRNLVLYATPHGVEIPPLNRPDLRIDQLPEMFKEPQILSQYNRELKASGLAEHLENYLTTGDPQFLSLLKNGILTKTSNFDNSNNNSNNNFQSTKYNIKLINSLVLYLGVYIISMRTSIRIEQPETIFYQLAKDLDSEGRYIFFNAIANQLRFPNNHTYFFSNIFLFLISDSDDVSIKEQITRVLFERVIVHGPHPFGLLLTFFELIRNERYEFFQSDFINNYPEIYRLIQFFKNWEGDI
ncbi:ccr4-not transcription complex [Anaeramoeba ignava]|uniref:Ccr4-not transcription complex n=1 Tax=Anaeramoeba ignava TaxID=1746090 RepID=A0A9Q0R9Q0_ANAIG|nr:ccr4-not transcription complex [Anaeramoeba ignava]